MIDYIKKTDDINEMIEIGRRIKAEKTGLYTTAMMHKMMQGVERHIPEADVKEKENMVYRSIYDWWVYGANVDEEFYYHFYDLTSREKEEYMVDNLRVKYIDHLNSGGGKDIRKLLTDKYLCYKRLQAYYKRDMIVLGNDNNEYKLFLNFCKKHHEFVVKPIDFSGGRGVHKVSLDMFNNDYRLAYNTIIQEGQQINILHPSKDKRIVLEEMIIQDESLSRLHPNSVNAVRATAVRGKDKKIYLFHPWIKVGMNGTFVASAVLNGFDAEIDSVTGIVISDGFQENGKKYEVQPDTGIRIKGFQIPRWNEMIEMTHQLMEELPEYGYIGWDLVLTKDGWVVMEGNYNGDFMFQLINGRGYRKEFEKLIGWKFTKEYWWQQ